jgi:MoxR-like ATPase
MATCKFCNAGNLTWKRRPEGWRLYDSSGNMHRCRHHDSDANVSDIVDAAAEAMATPETPDETPLAPPPAPAPDAVWVPTYLRRALDRAIAGRGDRYINIGITGPAGIGKTTLAIALARVHGLPCTVVELAGCQTPDEVWYREGLADGRLTYEPTPFSVAIQREGIIVLNDLALVQSERVLNALNDLLDPTVAAVTAGPLGRIQRHPASVVVATWNEGSEYTSAALVPEQLLDRFRSGLLVRIPDPPRSVVRDILRAQAGLDVQRADALAALGRALTELDPPIRLSVRALLGAARQVAAGATLGEALWIAGLAYLSDAEIARANGALQLAAGELRLPASDVELPDPTAYEVL